MVVNLDGEEGEGRQIIHAKVAGVLDDTLFVAVGSLERHVVPVRFFCLVLPDGCFDSVQAAYEYWFIGHNVCVPWFRRERKIAQRLQGHDRLQSDLASPCSKRPKEPQDERPHGHTGLHSTEQSRGLAGIDGASAAQLDVTDQASR